MRCYQNQVRETKPGKLVSPSEGAGDSSGRGISIPFPLVDFKKMWDVVSDPTLFKGPDVSAKEGRALVAEYKKQYADYKKKGSTRSYGSWIKYKGLAGGAIDIHKANLNVAPKKGFGMPGKRYTVQDLEIPLKNN